MYVHWSVEPRWVSGFPLSMSSDDGEIKLKKELSFEFSSVLCPVSSFLLRTYLYVLVRTLSISRSVDKIYEYASHNFAQNQRLTVLRKIVRSCKVIWSIFSAPKKLVTASRSN